MSDFDTYMVIDSDEDVCESAKMINVLIEETNDDIDFLQKKAFYQLQHQKKLNLVHLEIKLLNQIGHYWLRKPCIEKKSNNKYLIDIIIRSYQQKIASNINIEELNINIHGLVDYWLITEYCWNIVFSYYDMYIKYNELFSKIFIPYNLLQKLNKEYNLNNETRININTEYLLDKPLVSYSIEKTNGRLSLCEKYKSKYYYYNIDEYNIVLDNGINNYKQNIFNHLIDIKQFQKFKLTYKLDSLFTWYLPHLINYELIDIDYIKSQFTQHIFT